MAQSSLSCACSTAARARAAIDAGLRSRQVPYYKRQLLAELDAQLRPYEEQLAAGDDGLGFVWALPALVTILRAAMALAGVAVVGYGAYQAIKVEQKFGEKVSEAVDHAEDVVFYGLAGAAAVAAVGMLFASVGKRKRAA